MPDEIEKGTARREASPGPTTAGAPRGIRATGQVRDSQVIVGLGLLNVRLVRGRSATSYRGGTAGTLRDEFAAYGLPGFAFYLVGALKTGSAIVLIAGVWMALPVQWTAGLVAALMVCALATHLKVGDPPRKSLPAALMLAMSVAIVAQRWASVGAREVSRLRPAAMPGQPGSLRRA